MGGPSFGFILLFLVGAIALLWVVGSIILVFRRRAQRQRLVDGPICGRCGYTASLGPDGFTRCPECGGDYASVGIIGPDTRTGASVLIISAGLGWVLAIAIFGTIITGFLGEALKVTITTTTASQSYNRGSRNGSLAIDASTVAITISGRAQPTSDVSTIDFNTGSARPQFVVDNITGLVTSSSLPEAPVGKPFDEPAIRQVVEKLLPNIPESELKAFQIEAVSCITQRPSPRSVAPGVRSSSTSYAGGRAGLNSSGSTGTSSMSQSGWVAIGGTLVSRATYTIAMAAIFFVIAVIGLIFLARTARPPKAKQPAQASTEMAQV